MPLSTEQRILRLEQAALELDNRLQVMLGHYGWTNRDALTELQAEAAAREEA